MAKITKFTLSNWAKLKVMFLGIKNTSDLELWTFKISKIETSTFLNGAVVIFEKILNSNYDFNYCHYRVTQIKICLFK